MILPSILLLILNAGLIVFSFFKEKERNSITQLIWPILFIFFVLPVSFHIAFDPFAHSEIVAINKALSYSILFNLSYISVYTLLFPVKYANYYYNNNSYDFTKKDSISTLIFVFAIAAILVFNNVGISSALDSTWQNRSDLGIMSVIIIWILCLLSGRLCLAIENKKHSIALLIIISFILVALLFRTRDLVGVVVLSLILYIMIIRRGSLKSLIAIGAVGAFAAIGLRAMRLLGSLRSGLNFSAFSNMLDQVWEDIFVNGDLSVYRVYLQIVDLCDRGFVCFQGTIGQHIFSLSGVVDRPAVRFEYYLYDVLYASGVGGSLHPTAYGIAYGEYAIFGGCIFFAIFAAFNVFLSRISIEKNFFLIVGFVSHYTMFFARGSVYNGLTVVAIGAVAVVLTSFFSDHTRKNQAS